MNNNFFAEKESDTDFLEQLLEKKSFLHHQSATPLGKLRRNLFIGIAYGLIITLLYAWIIYEFPIWQVQAGLLIVTGFNFWVVYHSLKLIKNIDAYNPAGNVLQSLKSVRADFHAWFRQQYRMAVFIYPVATAAGFILGGSVGSGRPVSEFIGKPYVGLSLLGAIILFVPLGLLLARWMNRKAYGQYVDQLDNTIISLEKEHSEITDADENITGDMWI